MDAARHVACVFVVSALTACSTTKPVNIPSGWATTVTKGDGKVHASCQQSHKLTEPQGGSGSALARFGNAAVDDYAKLKADYSRCATWAKGTAK